MISFIYEQKTTFHRSVREVNKDVRDVTLLLDNNNNAGVLLKPTSRRQQEK